VGGFYICGGVSDENGAGKVDIEIGGGGLQQCWLWLSAWAIFVGAVRAIVGGG
jgi:hypothetical protein